MKGLVAGRSDINDVIAGPNHELDGRSLVQHAPVHRYLRSFGLGLDAYATHSRRVAASEDFFEFSYRLDVICIAEWSKSRRKMIALPRLQVGGGRFIQISLLPHQNDVAAFLDANLGRGNASRISAIHKDRGARRFAANRNGACGG